MTKRTTRTSASRPVYQSVRRVGMESSMALPDRRWRFHARAGRAALFAGFGVRQVPFRAENIAHTAARVQQRLRRILIDLSPQAVDAHLAQIGKRIKRFVPHMLGNSRAEDHASSATRKI